MPLTAALGRVLAADLVAGCDLPPDDTSAMDGWAVCGPPPWTVVGRALAGHDLARHDEAGRDLARQDLAGQDLAGQDLAGHDLARHGASRPEVAGAVLAAGRAVVIATGATLPPGTTGIVRTEHGLVAGARLRLLDPAERPDLGDVRPRGHEARAGEVLLPAGSVVHPPVVGLAASAGHDVLTVRDRARVGVLVLGDELLDAGPPRDGSVRDALGVQLPAWIEALGGLPAGVQRVPDDAEATRRAVDGAAVDVVVTTGGSARGAADHLRGALAVLGARIAVDGVDVRPGHPMLLAELPGGRRLVGLPGNPLAALVGVVTLLQPLLAGLAGNPLPATAGVPVAVDVPVLARGRRARGQVAVPVLRDPGGAVRPTGYATSAMLRGVARAEGLLLVPPAGLRAGEPGPVAWFPWVAAGPTS